MSGWSRRSRGEIDNQSSNVARSPRVHGVATARHGPPTLDRKFGRFMSLVRFYILKK